MNTLPSKPYFQHSGVGCSAFFKVWINGKLVHENTDIKRSWPYATAIEADLLKEENDILIKIDNPIDHLDFEIGFKEYVGKHPHQSQWDITLVPYV